MSLVVANGFRDEEGKKHEKERRTAATGRSTYTSGNSQNAHVTKTHDLRALPPSAQHVNEVQCHTVRRVEFSMILYKGGQDRIARMEDIIHTYTSIQCVMASAPRPLEDLEGWRIYYPLLAEYSDRGPIDCPMYLFETSLDLMEDLPGCEALLAIDCSLDVTQGVNYTNWQSLTKFYEEEGRPVDLTKFGKAWVGLQASRASKKGENIILPQLPFKSSWWATTFTNMIRRVQKAKATDEAEAVAKEEENIERYLRGVSVMQEVYASPRSSGSGAERIAILIWKFRKARKGEVASMTWRNLTPPVSPFQVQSPTPPLEQPPLTLDTTLHNMTVQHPASTYTDFYNPQQPSIFADNAEELLDAPLSAGSSPVTTPPSDYTSFPSSASTSFPSNISNSSYQPHLMQDSSFQSQDSVYPCLGSFSSQESQYHSQQELITHSQDIYDPQEGLYPSQQDALYHQTSTQIYDWPTPQTLYPDDTTAASQDFTGGKIQISYPQDENAFAPASQPPVYGPHLFAPQAIMTPHHQLIQHPEHLESQDYDLDPADLAAAALLQGERLEQQGCNIDWQLISSQPLEVTFQEGEMSVNGGLVQRYEEWREEIVGREEGGQNIHEQGHILGEVQEECVELDNQLEEYR